VHLPQRASATETGAAIAAWEGGSSACCRPAGEKKTIIRSGRYGVARCQLLFGHGRLSSILPVGTFGTLAHRAYPPRPQPSCC
jgi:hypothetical protein